MLHVRMAALEESGQASQDPSVEPIAEAIFDGLRITGKLVSSFLLSIRCRMRHDSWIGDKRLLINARPHRKLKNKLLDNLDLCRYLIGPSPKIPDRSDLVFYTNHL